MPPPDYTDNEKPPLQKAHEEITKEHNVAWEQRQAAWEYYLSSWKEEGPLKVVQRAEKCRNLQRAKVMASVTLSDLSKGCNANSHASCIVCEILFRAVQLSIPKNELSLNGTMTWPSFKWYEPTWSTDGSLGNEIQRQIEIFSKKGMRQKLSL
jgi:hypothetical protein